MIRSLFLTLSLATTTLAAAPQECLGRLIFTMPEHFQWAMGQAGDNIMLNNASFTKDMSVQSDRWYYNRHTNIIVSRPTVKKNFDERWREFMPKTITIDQQRQIVKSWRDTFKYLAAAQQENEEMEAKGEKVPDNWEIPQAEIDEAKGTLETAEAELYALESYKVPWVELDIPDARARGHESYHAFVWRNERVYTFYIRNDPITTLSDVNALLSTFIPRTLGEIPIQSGFCFPYGFIEDDGSPAYEIKNSFRFTDQPNVAYSFYTGDVNLETYPSIELQGIPHTAPLQLKEPKKFELIHIDQNIELNNGNKLQLAGWNITEKQPNDPKIQQNHYLVYGKIEGNLTKNNNPYIGVQIKAFDKNEADGRPNYAPPLEEAIKRLKPILESIEVNRETAPIKPRSTNKPAPNDKVKAEDKSIPIALFAGIFIMLASTLYGVRRAMSHLKSGK